MSVIEELVEQLSSGEYRGFNDEDTVIEKLMENHIPKLVSDLLSNMFNKEFNVEVCTDYCYSCLEPDKYQTVIVTMKIGKLPIMIYKGKHRIWRKFHEGMPKEEIMKRVNEITQEIIKSVENEIKKYKHIQIVLEGDKQ